MQRSALCRSRRELSNAYLLAKFGFDTAENEPFQVCPLSAYRSPRFGTLAVDFDKGSFEWTHAWKGAGGSSLAKDDRRVVCARRATGESIEVQPDVIVCRGEVRA